MLTTGLVASERYTVLAARWQTLQLRRLLVAALALSCLSCPESWAEPLNAAILKAVRASTFEVVNRKPTEDPLTYEKPLPLDLLPFNIRSDLYQPVGTAFAIDKNLYVTAAHVISAGVGSQFGATALRDSAGVIYEIDRVIKYSMSQDFAVFSLKQPARGRPLPMNRRPVLNSTVHAVGNALGEGVVVRDGLYTSNTPEQLDGRWTWIRFSAPASPGSSGGPLLDEHGKVIGLVLAVSPNENLNYALPIGVVLDASSGYGHIDARGPYGLPVMPSTIMDTWKEDYPLAADFAGFRNDLLERANRHVDQARALFLQTYGNNIFPSGDASQRLLHTHYLATTPRLIQMSDGTHWDADEASNGDRVDLAKNGWVSAGEIANTGLGKLRKPDDVPLHALFTDSRLFMDLYLKGVTMTRKVGAESVRITSAGAASTDTVHTDRYGRTWQLRTWPIPYVDFVVIAFTLPVPSGYIVLARTVPTGLVYINIAELKLLSDLIYVTYSGTLPQWGEFLAEKSLLPAVFSRIEIAFRYQDDFRYTSPRLRVHVDGDVLLISEKSNLALKFSYFPDHGKPVWDVAGLALLEDVDRETYVDVLRWAHPPEALPDTYQSAWRNRSKRSAPFGSAPYYEDNRAKVSTTLPLTSEKGLHAEQATGLYEVDFVSDVPMPAAEVRKIQSYLLKGIEVRE